MPDHTEGTAGAAATGAAPITHCQLRDLLHKHLQPETLDADNMWLCSGCQNKVCATKAQAYSQLPRAMMMHLKRFRYDPVRCAILYIIVL
jgi:ubiquitin C-terminal hydrolase